jgi:hypothetical protein
MTTTTAPSTTAAFPPVIELSPADAREVLRQVQASVPVELPPAQIDDRAIPGGPTGEVSIRIVRPADTTGVLPVVFHSRGGGWIPGDKDTYERLGCELANQAQAVVVFDYTRAPEAHYPIQNEQAYTALHRAIPSAAQISADPDRPDRQRRRQHDRRAHPDGQATRRTADRGAAAVLPGHRRQPRHQHLPAPRRGPLAQPRGDALVLGLLPPRPGTPVGGDRLTAAGIARAATRTPPGPDHQRRAGRAPRRGRGLRPQTLAGGRAGHPGPLRRHDTIHTVLLNPITDTVNGMPVCQDQVSRARENLVAADAIMSAAKAQGRERTIAARRKLSTQ